MNTTLKTKTETMQAKLVDTLNGAIRVRLTAPLAGIIPLFESCGYTFSGFSNNHRQRPELQGLPTFSELCGPMWDGGNVRYESSEACERLSL